MWYIVEGTTQEYECLRGFLGGPLGLATTLPLLLPCFIFLHTTYHQLTHHYLISLIIGLDTIEYKMIEISACFAHCCIISP